jgi:hypothetical protein
MLKILLNLSLFLFVFNVFSQELNCKVVVSAEKIASANPQIFKTLETSINDFMNQTKWTNKIFNKNEKIECSLLLTLIEQEGGNYKGSIQVQSSRPVFNSVYTTPILNYKDEDLTFSYQEFEPLQFDVNSYESELVSTLSYFAYMVIALDADTFAPNGGDEYFNSCQKIVDQVENPIQKNAWKSNTNKLNRYHLLNKLMSPTFKNFRQTLYNYHLTGIDKMADDKNLSKENIKSAIIALNSISSMTMGSQLVRFFMDAKSDEIVNIFSADPSIEVDDLIDVLNKISPTSAQKWEKIN